MTYQCKWMAFEFKFSSRSVDQFGKLNLNCKLASVFLLLSMIQFVFAATHFAILNFQFWYRKLKRATKSTKVQKLSASPFACEAVVAIHCPSTLKERERERRGCCWRTKVSTTKCCTCRLLVCMRKPLNWDKLWAQQV